MKHFLSIDDVPNLDELIELAQQIKAKPHAFKEVGSNKSLAMMFFNSSLRTRLSTDLAAAKLGMHRVSLNVNSDSWGLEFGEGAVMNANKAEHVKEAAPVIGGYADILAIRSFPSLKDRDQDYSEQIMNAFKQYAGVPILSMESATLHPLQSLADSLTIRELFPQKKQLKVVLRWAPHPRVLPQAVSNSFAQWMQRMNGVDLHILNPEGFNLSAEFTANAKISHDPTDELQDADIVYVKNWSTFEPYAQRVEGLDEWCLKAEDLSKAPYAKVMHCLPVRRNVVLADDILDGSYSAVQQQANNRLWSAMAVLHELIKAN